MNSDKFEEATAEILGQIQASVAEYVRTMNEAGALRRREVDEAQRQHDQVVASIKTIETQGKSILEENCRLSSKVANDWLGLVERGLQDAVKAQAREAAQAVLLRLEERLESLTRRIERLAQTAEDLAAANEKITKSLPWKALGVVAMWVIAATLASRLLLALS